MHPAELEANPRVSSIHAEKEFAALEPEWNLLLGESATDSIFLTWEWISSWWAAYGAGRDLRVYRTECADDLLGIAPLYRQEVRLLGPVRYRALFLIGDGSFDSDYLDWIARRGREQDVVRAVLDRLRADRADWDLLLVNEIPVRSPTLASLRACIVKLGWHWSESRVPCARVPLPPTWDEYLRMLKPRMRTKIRSLVRTLGQTFLTQYDRCTDDSDLENRLNSLFDLHQRRWAAEGKPGVFQTPEKRRFYDLMSRRFLDRGWLRFYSLRAQGSYVAHQLCFERDGTMFLLQEGLDPDWFAHGAGNALRAYVIRDCIERGITAYDFLGGVTPHKLSWGSTVNHSLRVVTGPRSIRNNLLFAARRARGIARSLLRNGPAPENGE